jgi:very-short-patch-repair endonuclease
MATNINAAKRYKDIPLPFICPISNRKFDSTKGISIYVTKTLKMDHKEYYDKYINHRENSCFFCGKEGLFMSVGKGYRNLCQKDECLKKSFVAHSVKGIMYREMISEEEAEIRFNELNSQQLENRMKTFEEKRLEDPDWDKKRSRNSKLFWLEKGLTEEEAEIKAYESMKDIHKKTSIKKKSNPEFYKDSYTTNIEYYLKNGFSEEESLKLRTERQSTFSLEICVEKYGEIEGKNLWLNRQIKWLKTLDSKSDEEKAEINRKKLNGNSYSKISQELFWNLYNREENNELIKFKELNSEFYLRKNITWYAYDYVNMKSFKIIEFNGDFWHCNPEDYESNYLHRVKKIFANEIWDFDKEKISFANEKGYNVLTIWESEYKKDKEATINKCINFLNEDNATRL